MYFYQYLIYITYVYIRIFSQVEKNTSIVSIFLTLLFKLGFKLIEELSIFILLGNKFIRPFIFIILGCISIVPYRG